VVFKLVRLAAEAADTALAAAVSPPLEMLLRQSKERAMTDAEYARLVEEEKKIGYVDFDNYKAERAIRDRFTVHPWWEETFRAARRNPVTKMANQAEWAWQRLTRGWDDTALWSLDVYWAKAMSEQLLVMADITHGHPDDEEFPEFTDWTAALHKNAALLAAYANHFDIHDNDEAKAVIEGGQEAMRWIADHLPILWD